MLSVSNSTQQLTSRSNEILPLSKGSPLAVQIIRSDTGKQIASTSLPTNVSDNEVMFALQDFTPSLQPYKIQLLVTTSDSGSYAAETDLLRLPDPTDGRTVTKIDNLFGSLLIQESGAWVPFLPYSFYIASWEADPPKLPAFAARGYNVLHVIASYQYDWFDTVADEAEKLGLWVMYDMRGSWRSASEVTKQVQRYAQRKNFLLWYTADEPGTYRKYCSAACADKVQTDMEILLRRQRQATI